MLKTLVLIAVLLPLRLFAGQPMTAETKADIKPLLNQLFFTVDSIEARAKNGDLKTRDLITPSSGKREVACAMFGKLMGLSQASYEMLFDQQQRGRFDSADAKNTALFTAVIRLKISAELLEETCDGFFPAEKSELAKVLTRELPSIVEAAKLGRAALDEITPPPNGGALASPGR